MVKLAGKRILVVEDEPLIAMLIEDIVNDLGGCCAVAESVAGALALFNGEKFDGAVIDVNLKGETSVPIGAKLRESAIPFVYTTGYGERADSLVGEIVLSKPFTEAQLSSVLGQMLEA